MRGLFTIYLVVCGAALAQGPIHIDSPADGSIFPPEFASPAFLWRDDSPEARAWTIEVSFDDGGRPIRVESSGSKARPGEIDPDAVASTNELPKQDEALRSWRPDATVWAEIKRRSTARPATVAITGFAEQARRRVVSRGSITVQTSTDPVGSPIFYRDVPLMPSELEKGVIKPLPQSALPLIAWRLRSVSDTQSRTLIKGLPTCANCHSFSADGTTLGMDLDGPQNDKGLYALARVAERMSIRNDDVISWSSFSDESVARMRVGFMSQVSPDGRYVVTTVSGTKQEDIARSYYVANFKDYRFLQVFYATRGILVWYDRATGRRQPLPGADDPRYVQTNAVWSPDGKYLVFARAEARDAYPGGGQMAEFANDPRETQVRYDLYRIPFNGGKGGRAEPINGASGNGMSNSFPKVSPDGRWIVFVEARNGLLMRPGSELYIVPAEGGQARRLRANLPVMNSWHSFSPNGRWLVFSSKGKSPYTQMFLTHLDEAGNDSPAILIENATAANRAVNIPEFVKEPPGGLLSIDIPAVEFYRLFDRAYEAAGGGRFEEAIRIWGEALKMSPDDAKARNNLAFAMANTGRLDEAIEQWQKAARAGGDYAGLHENLGRALLSKGRLEEAIPHLQRALEMNPAGAQTRNELGVALSRIGKIEEARVQFEKALETDRNFAQAHVNLGNAYYLTGRAREALAEWREGLRIEPDRTDALNQAAWVMATNPEEELRDGEAAIRLAARAVKLSQNREAAYLDTLAASYAEAGQFAEAVRAARQALSLAKTQPLAEALKARIALYEGGKPFRENPRRPEPAGIENH